MLPLSHKPCLMMPPPEGRQIGNRRLHRLTISGLIHPGLVFGKGSVVLCAGADAEFELALASPAALSQALTLLAFGVVVVACTSQLASSSLAPSQVRSGRL
jgi:hypothetical protein